MIFDLSKAPIYKSVKFARMLPPRILAFVRTLLLAAGAGAGAAYAVSRGAHFDFSLSNIIPSLIDFWRQGGGTLAEPEQIDIAFGGALGEIFGFSAGAWLDIALFAFAAGFSVLFWEIYYSAYISRPRIANTENPIKSDEHETRPTFNGINIAEFLDAEAAFALAQAHVVAGRAKQQNVAPSAVLHALCDSLWVQNALSRAGITPRDVQKGIADELGIKSLSLDMLGLRGARDLSPESSKLMEDAHAMRQAHGHERTSVFDLLSALYDAYSPFQRMVIDAGLDKHDLENLAQWYEKSIARAERRRKFWNLENLMRTPPIGLDWAHGYPRILSKFTRDLTMQFQRGEAEVTLVGRDNMIRQMEQIFSRSEETNVLLVGEEGVGKNALVLALAERFARGHSLPHLNYRRIFALDVSAVLSSSTAPSEVQNVLRAVLNEAAKVGNAVLFVEGIHNFVGGGKEGVGRADISEILVPYLRSSEMHIVATSDPASFHKYLETRGDIVEAFERIEVPALSSPHTLTLIEDRVPTLEKQFGLFFTYQALKAIVDDADRYIQIVPFPEKAFDLLDDVVSIVRARKQKIVLAQDVHDVVRNKTGIPVGEVGTQERETLMNLEQIMHESIIGQETAVEAVSQTMRRLRSGLSRRGRPSGVFLFVGPTGVGKTETAKTLARVYFDGEDKMIRLDMSEYQNPEAVDRLLGSPRLNEPGQLPSAVRDNPFSVLLLDEFEKAHKDILNVFLQVFDEGYLTDAWGRKVVFEQNLIIATSNAAAAQIRQMVQEGQDPSQQKEKIIELLIGGGYFSPELLNRFDEVVVFHPLAEEHIRKIAGLMLKKLQKRLKEQGYSFSPTPELVEYLVRVGFDPQFGARPMQRAIQDHVEATIAKRILEGSVRKGEEFTVEVPD